MAIGIVSDVHLGWNQSRNKDFLNFLIDYNEKELILLGDIFDFWRKSNAVVVNDNDYILELLSSINKVTYIVGNHDYSLLNYNSSFNIKKNYRITDYGINYYMDHGYILDVFGNMEPMTVNEYESFSNNMCNAGEVGGTIASYFYGGYEWCRNVYHANDKFYDNKNINRLATGHSLPLIIGLNRNEKYIFGHTHEAFINDNIANTGCWIKGTPCNYILIEHGKMELKEWVK